MKVGVDDIDDAHDNLADDFTDYGSWADEMEDMPLPCMAPCNL